MVFFRVFCLIFCCTVLGACLMPHEAPTELMGGLKSYSRSADLRQMFLAMGLVWEEAGIREREVTDYNIVIVNRFCYWGQKGRLRLGFFGDLLMETTFDPDKWESFKPVIDHVFGKSVQYDDEMVLNGGTLVVVQRDYRNRFSVSWRDTVLSKKLIKRLREKD